MSSYRDRLPVSRDEGAVIKSVQRGSATIVAGNTSSPDVKFQGASSGSGLKSEAHSHSFSGTTASAGNNTGHANWQPFITVYMWVKTA